MRIDMLKEQARRQEQAEQWAKALDFYLQAIEVTEASDEPDIALFNRVGDLQIRVGDLEGAVSTYERAIDLYVEAELPNNAIAVCQKIIRNVPSRATPFLRMGQVKARQGFAVDARQNFLTYAEMKQSRGETEEAFRALQEFVALVPGDVETRVFLAEQFAGRGDVDEAISHLDMAHRHLVKEGDDERARKLRTRASELDPAATLSSEPVPDESARPLQGGLVGFETTAMDDALGLDDALAAEAGADEVDVSDIAAGSHEEEADDLAAPEEVEAAFGALEFGGLEDEGEDEPLPGLEVDDEGEEEVVEPLPGLGDLELDQEEPPPPEERMEVAFEESAAGDEAVEEEPAPPEPELPVQEEDHGGEFVDLGAMVLDDQRERTTRWKVQTEGPSGDEQADFARMLSQFKEKVAENLDTGDFTARYDLGAAYKEMGLLDEAIGEFQAALRAHPGGLAALEMLGQCFLDKGEPQAGIRTLQRALAVPHEVEDDLLGIYYYLAQCYEAAGDQKQALEFYEKIFSLDINFKDVTERLRVLR